MSALQEYRQRMAIWWNERTRSEQRISMVGFVVFAIAIVVAGLVSPLVTAHSKADAAIERRSGRLFELMQIERDMQLELGIRKNVKHGRPLRQQSPISFIEGIADRAGIKEKIEKIRPGANETVGSKKFARVSFEMSELTMEEFIDVMYELETGRNIDVEVVRMQVDRRERKDRRIDVSAELRILQ